MEINLSTVQATKLRTILAGYPEAASDPEIAALISALDEKIERLYQEHDCLMCGATITPGTNGRPRMYCSDACRQRAYRAKLTDIRRNAWMESRDRKVGSERYET